MNCKPVLFAPIFLLLNLSAAIGCQCVGEITVPQALDKAKVVFSGTAVAEVIIKPQNSIYGLPAAEIELVMIKFKVNRWWKGEPSDEILLFTGSLRKADGITIHSTGDYRFKIGEPYLVYASEYAGQLVTNHCLRTKALATAEEDLTELGEGRIPDKLSSLTDPTSFVSAPVALAQAPPISIKPQAEAPLLIRLEKVTSQDPYAPAFEYSVVNTSDKPIQAYTIRIEDGLVGSHLSVLKSALGPGQSQVSDYGNTVSSEPVRGIRLAVDLVEFADGTIWGPDTTGSADQLSGMHAGRIAERDRLVTLLDEEGVSAVIKDVEGDEVQRVAPVGHSERWEEGFRTGARYFRLSIRDIYRRQGEGAMEVSLRQ